MKGRTERAAAGGQGMFRIWKSRKTKHTVRPAATKGGTQPWEASHAAPAPAAPPRTTRR